MFTFLHGYTPDTFDAMIKAGLVRKNDGIRFCESLEINEELKFNNLARIGGKLYDFVKETKCPFYIDRLQGGCYIESYDYDKTLLAEYKNMLGDNFWGFQMHEWLSNYFGDANNKLKDIPADAWTKENIKNFVYGKWPGKHLFIEAMTLDELVEAGKPVTVRQFYENMTNIYKKRMKMGDLIPCDSYMLAYPFELSCGTKRIMPEVGKQTPDTRIQVCFARGMTRQNGKSFGIYYEPWGGKPFSACMYNSIKNEWGIDENSDFPFKTAGPNGGSSRSLQKRIFLYGYLNNAEFISEEWGVYNTFLDCTEFVLSPYGKVKKDFIDFVEKYSDVGEKIAPFAAVIPSDVPSLDNVTKDDVFCGYTVETPRLNKCKEGLRKIFVESTEMLGTELKNLKNSDIPDAVDIINATDELLNKYDYLIDLTFDGSIRDRQDKIRSIDEIGTVLREVMPVYVDGGLHWIVNKCTSGGHYLTVFNHSGVERTVDEGEKYLPEAEKTVKITFQKDTVPKVLEGSGRLEKIDGQYYLTVPAGDYSFIWFE